MLGSGIEILGVLEVTRSETVRMETRNTYIQYVPTFDDDDIQLLVQPGDVALSIPPAVLSSLILNEDVLHLKFTGAVNVTPLDRYNVQRIYMTCHADSNINWFWKTGLSQPDNRVEGVATVVYPQYARYIHESDGMVIRVNMSIDLSAGPQRQVDRVSFGNQY